MTPTPEVTFEKYQSRGSDYHWQQINRRNLLTYNAFVMARYQCYLRELDELTKQRSHNQNLRIADFGCGTGTLLFLLDRHLAKKGFAVETSGVDIQPEAITAGQRLFPKATLRCESVYATGWPSNSFDVAIAADVIEHVQEPQRLIQEMLRVIGPEGVAIIGTPIRWTEKPQDTMHVREFFPGELAELCRAAGATVVRQKYSHSLLSFLIYQRKVKIFGRKFALGRYVINALDILFGHTVFSTASSESQGMIYQYIVLRRSRGV